MPLPLPPQSTKTDSIFCLRDFMLCRAARAGNVSGKERSRWSWERWRILLLVVEEKEEEEVGKVEDVIFGINRVTSNLVLEAVDVY